MKKEVSSSCRPIIRTVILQTLGRRPIGNGCIWILTACSRIWRSYLSVSWILVICEMRCMSRRYFFIRMNTERSAILFWKFGMSVTGKHICTGRAWKDCCNPSWLSCCGFVMFRKICRKKVPGISRLRPHSVMWRNIITRKLRFRIWQRCAESVRLIFEGFFKNVWIWDRMIISM